MTSTTVLYRRGHSGWLSFYNLFRKYFNISPFYMMRVGYLFEKMPFHIKETVFCSCLLEVKVINGCWICQIPFFCLTMIMWVSLFFLFSSVQFSRSVMSDSLRPHESQRARPPSPSPTPRVHPNSCPWSWWCHPAISSSVVPFSSCLQSLPASESFSKSQLFTWGGQSTGVSALASVPPMNTQDWSTLGWTGWISLQSKGLSRVVSNTTVQKHQFFGAQLSSQSNSHIHTWPLEQL